jgi:ParB/RepB/Spo0J family partition protein
MALPGELPLVSGEEGEPSSAPEPKTPPRKKKGRPKKAEGPKSNTTLSLPSGVTLSEEICIPLEQLVPTQNRDADDNNTREEACGAGTALVESLRNLGQLVPIIVQKVKDPGAINYDVLAGSRRTLAAKPAGLKSLRARIYEGCDEGLPYVISFVENELRLRESPWSLAKKLAAAEKAGINRKQLEAFTGKSKGTISELIAATKLPAAYRERIEAGEDLYAVVREYKDRPRKKDSDPAPEQPVDTDALPTAVHDGNQDNQHELADRPTALTGDALPAIASTSTMTGASEETPRTEYDRRQVGNVVLIIASNNGDKPSPAEVVKALKHALDFYEPLARAEG